MASSQYRKAIPIVMAFDSAFYFPACVAVCSVMEHANPDCLYSFFFLTDENPDQLERGVFRAMAGKYSNFSWKYIEVNRALFHGVRRSIDRISISTYYRLLIPDLLPDTDRCLYLDSDLIACGDVASIFDVCSRPGPILFDACYLAAVPDITFQLDTIDWTKKHLETIGMERDSTYFNAGVLLMNLSLLRKNNMVRSLLSDLKKQFIFADQDILNRYCIRNVLQLPVRCNLEPRFIGNPYVADTVCRTPDDWQDLSYGRPLICHFAGSDKPWNAIRTFWDYLWYKTAMLLPSTDYVREQLVLLESRLFYSPGPDRLSRARLASRLILYGFTKYSFCLCDFLLASGFTNLYCFCDRNPAHAGLSHNGIPCFGKEILPSLPQDSMIIICAQKAWKEILHELLAFGIDSSRLARFEAPSFTVTVAE